MVDPAMNLNELKSLLEKQLVQGHCMQVIVTTTKKSIQISLSFFTFFFFLNIVHYKQESVGIIILIMSRQSKCLKKQESPLWTPVHCIRM